MDPLALLPKAFDNTLGALLVGGLAAMAFLDTFDTVLNCHILYFYLVSNYINPFAIMVPIWSVIVSFLLKVTFLLILFVVFKIHVAVTSISNFIIRSLFARRAYRLGKNIPSTIWIVAVSVTDLVVGILITAKALVVPLAFLELNLIIL
ncbi:hypothetical protein MPER_09078 [Moniliophthora perniciosa FA553]|nr:hypothetical protein MPER_09078 [Moniliophthora perniciosa FA553]